MSPDSSTFCRARAKLISGYIALLPVILTRLHRVTFLTAHEYLGLTKELVKTERAINDLASYPLPTQFYESGGIERLRQRFLPETKAVDRSEEPKDADYFHERKKNSYPLVTPYMGPRMGGNNYHESSFHFGPEAMRLKYPSGQGRAVSGSALATSPISGEAGSPLPPRTREGSSSSPDSRVSRNVGDLLSMTSVDSSMSLLSASPDKTSVALPAVGDGEGRRDSDSKKHISFAIGPADEFDLRDAVMTCISKSIGLIQPSHSTTPSAENSPVLQAYDAGLKRAVFSSSFGSLGYLGLQGKDDATSITSSSMTGSMELAEMENETEILFFPRGSTLIKAGEKGAGLFFVIEGLLDVNMPEGHVGNLGRKAATQGPRPANPVPKGRGGPQTATSAKASRNPSGQSISPVEEDKPKSKVLFSVKPGGIAGYLSSLSGFASYVDIVAKTDVYVGFLPAKALDKIMDRKPIVLLTLAKRLISLLPPLVVHIDSALEWMQVNAGQVIYRQGEKADSFYFVNQGRLRSIAEKEGTGGVEILAEYGQSDSVGECESALHRLGMQAELRLFLVNHSGLHHCDSSCFDAACDSRLGAHQNANDTLQCHFRAISVNYNPDLTYHWSARPAGARYQAFKSAAYEPERAGQEQLQSQDGRYHPGHLPSAGDRVCHPAEDVA